MNILNNSIIDTIIEYASVKFGVEMSKETLAPSLKELGYTEVLDLIDAVNDEDDERFTDYIDLSAVNEAITPQSAQGSMSAASLRASRNGNDRRDAVNAQQDSQRDTTVATRKVAGGNIRSTGTGAARYDKRQDPDDVQRAQNAQSAGQARQQAANNAQEIARLKQLAQGRR